MVPPCIGCLCSLFEDDVILAFELQMITNRKTSLSTSNDYGVKFPELFHDITSLAYSLSFLRSEANDAVVLQLQISRKLLLDAPKSITIDLALSRSRFYPIWFNSSEYFVATVVRSAPEGFCGDKDVRAKRGSM
jgi:hypothetical protein